jgi:hypothetical protein
MNCDSDGAFHAQLDLVPEMLRTRTVASPAQQIILSPAFRVAINILDSFSDVPESCRGSRQWIAGGLNFRQSDPMLP